MPLLVHVCLKFKGEEMKTIEWKFVSSMKNRRTSE